MPWMFSLDDVKLEPFTITVWVSGKSYKMTVTQLYCSVQIERFEIKAGEREFHLQSDRPMLRAAESRKGIHWKIIKGEEMVLKNPEAFKDILQAIEDHIRTEENPPPTAGDHQKNK